MNKFNFYILTILALVSSINSQQAVNPSTIYSNLDSIDIKNKK